MYCENCLKDSQGNCTCECSVVAEAPVKSPWVLVYGPAKQLREIEFSSLSECLAYAGEFDELAGIELDHQNQIVYITFFHLPEDQS